MVGVEVAGRAWQTRPGKREEGKLNKFGRVLVRLIRVGKARTEVKKGPAFCDMRSAGDLLMGG